MMIGVNNFENFTKLKDILVKEDRTGLCGEEIQDLYLILKTEIPNLEEQSLENLKRIGYFLIGIQYLNENTDIRDNFFEDYLNSIDLIIKNMDQNTNNEISPSQKYIVNKEIIEKLKKLALARCYQRIIEAEARRKSSGAEKGYNSIISNHDQYPVGITSLLKRRLGN
jgi:hypothetical protein